MARPTLFTNTKFLCLADDLRLPHPYALGLLEYLWRAAYEAGKPEMGGVRAVELAAQWPGDPGILCAALTKHRFLDEVQPGLFAVHDFWTHAPDYVHKRRKRELDREAKGMTLGDMRSQAAHARWDRVTGTPELPADANGCKRQTLASGQDAKVRTPAPAPAPAPAPLSCPSGQTEGGTEEKSSERKPRQRDDLFDAVVEITASDPKASGSHIGRVCKMLRSADPPYTPDEVRALPPLLAARGWTLPVTLGSVDKYIGLTRAPPPEKGAKAKDDVGAKIREKMAGKGAG